MENKPDMMNSFRTIGTILVYGPVFGMLAVIISMVAAFMELANGKPNPDVLANRIAIALYSAAFAVLAYVFGVIIHGVVAARTGVYSRKVWRLILMSSILFCITNPFGPIIGGATIALLFGLETFKKMRAAE